MPSEKKEKKGNPSVLTVLSTDKMTVNQPTFRFGNGWVLKDAVTSFEGAVIYRCDNITGCNQYGLAPTKGDGETKHIDESRLTWTGKIVALPITARAVMEDPGGTSGLAKRG